MSRRTNIEIGITIEEPAWRQKWPSAKTDIAELLKRAAVLLPASAGAPPASKKQKKQVRARGPRSQASVVSVVLADDATLRRLNREFRGKDRPTNVLSFGDAVEPLGGIVISYQTVEREAAAQRKIFGNHAKHMILHGFLHLLGHDHVAKKAARLMEGIEIAILEDLGIPNPYLIEKKPSA